MTGFERIVGVVAVILVSLALVLALGRWFIMLGFLLLHLFFALFIPLAVVLFVGFCVYALMHAWIKR